MTTPQVAESASVIKFSDNFWESVDKNGITTLIERMRGAKQTCERYKHAYEARAFLEEEYGKTLLQIAQKQKASSLENGSSKAAMDTMQAQFQSVAESHLHLSNLLRENVALPLTKLLNKQRILRKEMQTSIQKLYNNRQVQVHFVRRAHKRHNLEIEKANLLVQQQTSEKDKRATFRTAEKTIDKLKKVYDEALIDLAKIVEDWNTEWNNTCESFEKFEQERLEFFKSNLSNCASLIIGCLEGEIQACEKINAQATKIDVVQDLVDFVKKNKSSDIVPTPMEYIKLHAYHEANQDRGDLKFTHNAIRDTIDNEDHDEQAEDRVHVHLNRKRSSIVSNVVSEAVTKPMERKTSEQQAPIGTMATMVTNEVIVPNNDATVKSDEAPQPVLMMGVMEVYASGDDDSDSEEYEYVAETESEGEKEDKVEEPSVKKNEVEEESQIKKVEESVEAPKVEEEKKNEAPVKEEQEEVEIVPVAPQEAPVEVTKQQKEMPPQSTPSPQNDAKVDRLTSAYHKEIQQKQRNYNPQPQQQPSMLASKSNSFFNPKRRVSFVESNPIYPEPEQATIIDNRASSTSQNNTATTTTATTPLASPSNILLERFNASPHSMNFRRNVEPEPEQEEDDDDYPHDSEDAAMELDDMLRELDSKRIAREEEDSVRYRRGHQADIKPTASMSSPSLQDRRGHMPNSYFPSSQQQQQQQRQLQSRRMSTIETPSYSRQPSFNTLSSGTSSYVDIYDPFNSLSSKETGSGDNSTLNSDPTMHYKSNGTTNSMRNKLSNSPPSAQMIHERMLQNSQEQLKQHRRSVSSSSNGSIKSVSADQQNGSYRGNNNKFIQDFYSAGSSKTPSPDNTIQKRSGGFIDFAFALYDYQEADEGEISFKEGDLLGIISKSEEEDEQGWWEASLLNRRNQKVIKTGLVPSNFLETASR